MDVKQPPTRQPSADKIQTPDFGDYLIEPFMQIRSEVDRLFESFPFRFQTPRLGRFAMVPAIDMTETDKKYRITAELPGIDPEQVDVTFEDGLLRIAGEKSQQRDENERGYRVSERTYGRFERLIELPPAADAAGLHAKFKDGVLTITVPKAEDSKRNVRKIAVERDK